MLCLRPSFEARKSAHLRMTLITACYSAGVVAGGGGLAGGGVVALRAAFRFSTMRTAMIEPS